MQQQKRTAEKQCAECDEAAKEFQRYDKLAAALGRKGLLARVVQTAQQRITINANDLLNRLSNGHWQVELQDVSENELQIQSLDLNTNQPRLFEYLSGGERFWSR